MPSWPPNDSFIFGSITLITYFISLRSAASINLLRNSMSDGSFAASSTGLMYISCADIAAAKTATAKNKPKVLLIAKLLFRDFAAGPLAVFRMWNIELVQNSKAQMIDEFGDS